MNHRHFLHVSLPGLLAVCTALLSLSAVTVRADIPAPDLPARAFILVDFTTGAVLAEKNADERLPPASLTKMMTTYIADQALHDGAIKMTDMVPVSENAWRNSIHDGSRMFLDVGSRVSVEDLLRGIIIQSGNDASVAMAEYLGGNEATFAAKMNQFAQKLGMSNTQFRNATGLTADGHYSTARDMATLSRAIIRDFPDTYPLYAEKEFKYNIGRPQQNRNLLLWQDPTVDGLKTGHTDAAGYCLAASAKRGDMRLVSVVLNTASEKARAEQTLALLNWGFANFETWVPYKAGSKLSDAAVWMGAVDGVELGVDRDVALTIPRGSAAQLAAAVTIDPEIRAPLHKGDRKGTLTIRLGDQVLLEQPLVALQDVEQGGIFKRLWHWLRLFFGGLFG
jgi:D-alanyl-D-alanine carboxypeptidase (penicillin-binding protein 5/6)